MGGGVVVLFGVDAWMPNHESHLMSSEQKGLVLHADAWRLHFFSFFFLQS